MARSMMVITDDEKNWFGYILATISKLLDDDSYIYVARLLPIRSKPSESENIPQPALSGTPITIFGIAHATYKIGSQDFDILNLLEKWV